MDMEAAAGLRMKARKSQRVDFSDSSSDEVREVLRLFATFAGVEIVRQGRYLGVLVGPSAHEHVWALAAAKFRVRVRHVAGMPLHFQQRVRAYRSVS